MKKLLILIPLLVCTIAMHAAAVGEQATASARNVIKITRPTDAPVSWLFSHEEILPEEKVLSHFACYIEHPEESTAAVFAKYLMVRDLDFNREEWKKQAQEELKLPKQADAKDSYPSLVALLVIRRDKAAQWPRARFNLQNYREYPRAKMISDALASPSIKKLKLFFLCYDPNHDSRTSTRKFPLHECFNHKSHDRLKADADVALYEEWQEHVRSAQTIGFEIDYAAVEFVWQQKFEEHIK